MSLALLGALLIGLSLGLLGSGGSILTVPVLVYLLGEPPKQAIAESLLIVGGIALLGGLPIHLAVGTSLFIIAMKSFAGFYKYLHLLPALGLSVNYQVAGLFVLVGFLGSLLGGRVAVRLPQESLKRGFALFLVAAGVFILVQNLD